MDDLWYKNAVIYGVDVHVFQDSDGDGWGDFRGVADRLDYLSELGVTCLWLLPFYHSPNRDNGYDISDYYHVDPHVGTLDDFEEMLVRAGERGIRVIIDLVMNHTSDQHPWFQAARRDPGSLYHDYYVWTDHPPPPGRSGGSIFPGPETSVWSYDEVARSYYFHQFYHFQPGLRVNHPAVREEVRRVMDFWLSFPISGFRLDAAPHMIEPKGLPETALDNPHGLLKELRAFVEGRKQGAVLLGESDVRPDLLATYFGDGDELNLLFNFLLANYLFLALARRDAGPLQQVLRQLPSIPDAGQWANFLRNLDELDLERLNDAEREEVFAAFAPEERMRVYNRGIRRRLAPMLDGDRRRLELAYSLLFSLPGVPVLVYGDEIGMGEDLDQPERNAVRTPMQWSVEPNAGFSTGDPQEFPWPVIDGGRFGYRKVNVEAQRADPGSLLNWIKRLIAVRLGNPEIGWGNCYPMEVEDPRVFAHRCEWKGESLYLLHNLGDEEATVELDLSGHAAATLLNLFGDAGSGELETDDGIYRIRLAGFGYRWLRVGKHAKTLTPEG